MSCKKRLFDILNVSEDCYSDSSSCNESGKSFSIKPKTGEKYCIIKVDGCLISSNNVHKCDFIIVKCDDGPYHFIELKGNDIGTAYKQISNTITTIHKKFQVADKALTKDQIAIHIVCNLSTKSNQKKDEITEAIFKKFSIRPKFYTKDSVQL